MALIVDASVAIKWFVSEPQADQARAILAMDDVLFAPSHAVGEVLVRHVRHEEMTFTQMDLALTTFLTRVRFVSAPDLVRKAAEIAVEIKASVYDTIYVGAAHELGFPLVTADEALIGKIGLGRWARHIIKLADWSNEGRDLQ